ncbi:MAG: hypothetical protein N2449_00420 [Bacteroidales bacterium]|nr:hypothetical protein [Bacteroidales bacterium]
MKIKVIAITLIVALFSPLLLSYIVFSILKFQLKEEFKTQILNTCDKSKLLIIKVENSQLSKIKWENDHEFEIANQMYDVIDSKRNADTTYFWVWHDEKESYLNKEFTSFIHSLLQHDAQKRHKSKLMLDLLKLTFIVADAFKVVLDTNMVTMICDIFFEYVVYQKTIEFPPEN